MFNNYPSDGSKKIATVMAVDIRRGVCKCLSDTGEVLTDVRWVVPMGGADGAGSSFHPTESSRVLVDVSSGFPFILGAILSEGTNDVRRPNIGKQDENAEDIADYTTIDAGDIIRGPGIPLDQRVGDTVTTSDGGAIQGVLRSGTVINKASPMAQLILSRYGDAARLVSRNYEHYTDVDQTIKASAQGNVYAMREVYQDPKSSREEASALTVLEGNIPAAEAMGKDYVTNEDGPVAIDTIVQRTTTYADGVATSVEDLHTDGTHTMAIGEAVTVAANPDGTYQLTAGSGGFRMNIAADGAISMESDSTLDVVAKDTVFDLSDVTFKTSGTTTFDSAGNIKMTAPTIQLN